MLGLLRGVRVDSYVAVYRAAGTVRIAGLLGHVDPDDESRRLWDRREGVADAEVAKGVRRRLSDEDLSRRAAHRRLHVGGPPGAARAGEFAREKGLY
jgi:hypothetical protein